ncbi:MAG: OmpP1/FadL family transporter [Sulfurimonadaceae bacterium]
MVVRSLFILIFLPLYLFATNGSNLIGYGSKSRGMGGIGIGLGHGAESGLANGALITSVAKNEISFGGTVFMPDVSFDNGTGAGAKKSQADMSIIPEVSLASKVSEEFFVGVGMWGTAGMGVDYRRSSDNFSMVTNLQLMQFGVPLAVRYGDFSFALTPLIQYGSLDISYNASGTNQGEGVAQDYRFGYNLGVAYANEGFVLGGVYKSQIDMQYSGQLSTAMAGFGITYPNDTLSTPAEIGIGASYIYANNIFALDWKQIRYGDAKGFKDFGWEHQNVFIVGYSYKEKNYTLRLGYNYAKSPIPIRGLGYTVENTMNLLGFPAIVESHIGAGGSYRFNETVSFDLAYVHAIEAKQNARVMNPDNVTTRIIETKHSQSSLSLQLNFLF